MSTNFPGSLDTLTNPQATDSVADVSHAAQHANANDAIEALQAKVGIDGSSDTDSHDYKLQSITATDQAASKEAQDAHIADTSNPHEVTKDQVGLGNVDDTSDDTKNAAPAILENKTIDADNNLIENLEIGAFKLSTIVTEADTIAANNNDTTIPTSAAVQDAIENYVAENVAGGSFILPALESIDATALPKPVQASGSGVVLSEADLSARQGFVGFVVDAVTVEKPTYLNGQGGTDGITSFLAPAGEKRVIVLFVTTLDGGNPTDVSWNGQNFVQAHADVTASIDGSIWVLPIGDSLTDQTFNIVVTGGTYTYGQLNAICYDKVNQATPTLDADASSADAVNSRSLTLESAGTKNTIVAFLNGRCGSGETVSIGTSGYTQRVTHSRAVGSDNMRSTSGEIQVTLNTGIAGAMAGGTGNMRLMAVALNEDVSQMDISIQFTGVLPGFSGLTPGSKYYVQDTVGTIGTTPGTNSILVGKAISATELLIVHA